MTPTLGQRPYGVKKLSAVELPLLTPFCLSGVGH